MRNLTILFFMLWAANMPTLLAQVVSGTVIDPSNNETLVGVNVLIEGTGVGTITDLDGNYSLKLPEENTAYTLMFSYIGYDTKRIEGITATKSTPQRINVTMSVASAELQEVIVTATVRRESVAAMLAIQKNNVTIADVMPGDVIRKTPDRNTAEVLRRVSGATIEDGRFAIIRGLNDRYNAAMINNTLMPSTEPDRRAFSFDMIPSSMVDNMMVYKTAGADLPSEFAGGIIQVQTRDVPDRPFFNVQIGTSYNSVTTFKPYKDYDQKMPFLGLNNSSRQLPTDFPTNLSGVTRAERVEATKQLPAVWSLQEYESALPAHNVQLSGGLNKSFGNGNQIGFTVASTYSKSFRNVQIDRADFDFEGKIYESADQQFTENLSWGNLLNMRYVHRRNHKFSYQGIFTSNAQDVATERDGYNIAQSNNLERSNFMAYTATQMQTHQISGEHLLPKSQVKLSWNGNYTQIDRTIPDMRGITYLAPADLPEEERVFTAEVPLGSPSFKYGGRFFSNLHDQVVGGRADASIPFKMLRQTQIAKVGLFYQDKSRQFDARIMGMVRAAGTPIAIRQLPADQIFALENIAENRFRLEEATNFSDKYEASRSVSAAYAMWDGKLTQKLRTVLGVRFEQAVQDLTTFTFEGGTTEQQSFASLLPSLNISYALTPKSNLRFSASQTMSRPEFRELAPFGFYDFERRLVVTGNPNLKEAKIVNIDLRYELFPENAQLFSVSAFYKRFTNPIEQTVNSAGIGTFIITYVNATSANNMGAELELRKNFGFLGSKFEPLVFFSNLAYIYSKVETQDDANPIDRPLQGQSPYVMNMGLTYAWENMGLSATVLYNRIGARIVEVGDKGEGLPDIYEASRNLLDFQISKDFLKKGNIRLNVSDILNAPFVFFQVPFGTEHTAFTPQNDQTIGFRNGTTVGITLGYKF